MSCSSGAKSRNFQPYQCPSPKMAQRSAGSLMESFQSRITEMYRWILILNIVCSVVYFNFVAQGPGKLPRGGGCGDRPQQQQQQALAQRGGQHQEHQLSPHSLTEKVSGYIYYPLSKYLFNFKDSI